MEVEVIGNGGLSGVLLWERVMEVICYLVNKLEGKLLIIGVGGIWMGKDVVEKFCVGVCLV